jgi:hypothetical protein
MVIFYKATGKTLCFLGFLVGSCQSYHRISSVAPAAASFTNLLGKMRVELRRDSHPREGR